MLKRSPLEVRFPWNASPYQVALPIWYQWCAALVAGDVAWGEAMTEAAGPKASRTHTARRPARMSWDRSLARIFRVVLTDEIVSQSVG